MHGKLEIRGLTDSCKKPVKMSHSVFISSDELHTSTFGLKEAAGSSPTLQQVQVLEGN